MGIDYTGLHAILLSQKNLINKNRMLTMGRQHIHLDQNTFDSIVRNSEIDLSGSYSYNSEIMFRKLGFGEVDSLDYSDYEGATFIHDMNKQIKIKKTYDYIYDGGTIEHVFNTGQFLENVIDLLEVGGVFCSVTCNNNFSGHGFYQFSPEFFLSCFTKNYGMSLLSLYLAQVDTEISSWLDVKTYGSDNTGRNITKFDSINPVYIITVAKKISCERESLIKIPPQQYSYKEIDWKR